MSLEVNFYNSIDAAKILGVNVSTIKRWTDAGQLQCIKSPGGHRKFLMEHLSQFLETNKKKATKANLFPIENDTDLDISHHIVHGDISWLQTYIETEAKKSNRDKIQKVLNGMYLAQFPLHFIYDHLITPVLYRLGEQWEAGKLSISQEHLATQSIRDAIIRLQGIIKLPSRKRGRAYCLNLSLEMHDIALKLVDHVLEQRGFKILFSGQNTPSVDLDKVLQKLKPHRIYISSTIVDDLEKTQSEFNDICQLAKKLNAEIFIGGNGFDKIKYNKDCVKHRLYNFEEVYKI